MPKTKTAESKQYSNCKIFISLTYIERFCFPKASDPWFFGLIKKLHSDDGMGFQFSVALRIPKVKTLHRPTEVWGEKTYTKAYEKTPIMQNNVASVV
jgi:hypothetical protein